MKRTILKKLTACLCLCAVLSGALTVPAGAASFQDVPSNHWAATAIDRCAAQGWFQGKTADTFGVGQPMTRAGFAVALSRFFGWQSGETYYRIFSDVPQGAWYEPALRACYEHGAVTRQTDSFRPASAITREELAVMLIRAGLNAWAALLCAFLAGMLAGFVTGLFHTKCGIPAILAGILTQLSLYSINLRIMGSKANQAVGVDKYDLLVSQRYVRTVSLDNPLPLLVVFTVVLIAVLYWFFGTEKGCSLRATGANPNMARAQGINTNANVVLGLMVSNGLVALSGGLLAQFQGSSDINMGRGAIVIGLAAVIIGEVAFGKVFINFALKLLAVSIGAVIYYIVLQIVLQLGLNTNDLKLVSALIVAVFLAIPYWKGHIHTKKGGSVHA